MHPLNRPNGPVWNFVGKSNLGDFKLEQQGIPPNGSEALVAQSSAINRIVRSTAAGNWFRQLHDFTCQICGTRLETSAGADAEICYI
jgi:hypothetical protein